MDILVLQHKAQLESLPFGSLPENKQFHAQPNAMFLSTSFTIFLKERSVDYGHQPGVAFKNADFQAPPQIY